MNSRLSLRDSQNISIYHNYEKRNYLSGKNTLGEISNKTKGLLLTHAYVHWLADVHSAVFAPAFTLSFHDSECSRKPPNAHSLGRYGQQQKMKKRPCSCIKSLTN